MADRDGRSRSSRARFDDGDPQAPPSGRSLQQRSLDGVGDLFDAAASRTLAGRAFAQAGEPDRAAAELERAAVAFDSFGASRYRAAGRARAAQARPAHPPPHAPRKTDATGVGSLTARELEIARLIVDRKTNPEIASRAVPQPEDVETHIRNMFRKLGVVSRVELARAVERSARPSDAA